MGSPVKKAALIGVCVGFALVGLVVVIAFTGPTPPGGSGERLMGLSLLLTRVGFPTSLLVVALADALGSASTLFPVVYVLLLIAILLTWGVLGAAAGWLLGVWQRSRSTVS